MKWGVLEDTTKVLTAGAGFRQPPSLALKEAWTWGGASLLKSGRLGDSRVEVDFNPVPTLW